MELKERLQKTYKTIDQMVTMHAILHDYNQRLALVFDILLLCTSTVLCATVFLDPSILTRHNISSDTSKLVIGICSIITFLISLISLRVNWKQKGDRHAQARDTLSRLKLEGRALLKSDSPDKQEKIGEYLKVYDITMDSLPVIPENQFHKLKATHKRKVEFSKFIDKYPRVPYLSLKLHFLFYSFRNIQTQKNRETERGDHDINSKC